METNKKNNKSKKGLKEERGVRPQSNARFTQMCQRVSSGVFCLFFFPLVAIRM